MLQDRIEGKWIDAFVEVFRNCGATWSLCCQKRSPAP